MKYSDANVIIIDDNIPDDDPIIEEAKIRGINIIKYEMPDKALSAIEEKLGERIIVILDIMFSPKTPNGHDILAKIREKSLLIPVILWSAVNEKTETFSDFINNHAFAFFKKTSSSYIQVLDAVEKANEHLNSSVEGMIEEWIEIRERNQKYTGEPYLIEASGRSYTLEELLGEIRLQTTVGREFIRDLHMLTIDLLRRNKEKLK